MLAKMSEIKGAMDAEAEKIKMAVEELMDRRRRVRGRVSIVITAILIILYVTV